MTTKALWCLCDLPKVEERQSYKATDHKASTAVSFGQTTLKTLKDMLLNVVVIEKNCTTPVMKSPVLWDNMAWVSPL